LALKEFVDPEFLRRLVDATGTPDASPPARGTQVHGFDGTYARRVRTDADGYVQIKSV